MEKSKKLKIILGLLYLILVSSFLYFLFSEFSFEDFRSIKIIQSNVDKLNDLKNNNLIFLGLLFCIFTAVWVLFLGFGTPVALIGGFIFGKWLGTLLITIGLSTGALGLYLVGKYFFYDFLKDKLLFKFKHLEKIFHNKQLFVMIIFRFVGLVPFFIANLLPVIFNINIKNYFIGTFIGIIPSIFIMSSLGSGISNAIFQFETFPSFISLIILPEIYLPILGFFIIILISLSMKKIFKK
jgi:uncharacterized membrane protein YdjX (TVP38/TMEM64 family)